MWIHIFLFPVVLFTALFVAEIDEVKQKVNDTFHVLAINLLKTISTIFKKGASYQKYIEVILNNYDDDVVIQHCIFASRNRYKILENKGSLLSNSRLKQLAERKLVKKTTLVLDLDETLIHSSIETKSIQHDIMMFDEDHKQHVFVFKRPGLHYFLESVELFFDVALFTSSYSCYCDPIVNNTVPVVTKSRFYNTSLINSANGLQKDLSLVSTSRMPKSLIMLDNSPLSIVTSQRENVYVVDPFRGDDPDDQELVALIPFLLAVDNLKDVRSILHRRIKFEKTGY